MHYYRHHIGDFIAATARLSNDQTVAYLRLLWMYYESEKPLPDDIDVLSLKIGADAQTVSVILRAFFIKDNDLWTHSRCDQEIAEYNSYREAQREKGKKGGRPKKPAALPEFDNGKPGENPEKTLTNNHYPINNNYSCHQPTANDACPHQEIISLYAECLPELAQIRTWEGSRQKNLCARWRWVLADLAKKGKANDRDAGLEFFRRMFLYIQKSDFLMGRSGKWQASLPWIVNAENFAKIIEGQYENREAA